MENGQDYFSENAPNSEAPEGKKPLSRTARLILGIGAAVVMLVLGLTFPYFLADSQPKELALTVFSNDWSEVVLKPGVETALNDYLASGSSAPGFPLKLNWPGVDEMQLSVDAGVLFTWGSPSYVAVSRGAAHTVVSDDTVYWSPYGEGGSLVPHCTLTVIARSGGADISQERFILRQTAESGYSITRLAG